MKKWSTWLNYLLNTALTAGGFIVLWILIRVFVFDTFPVNTESMYPTIRPGDRILVNKLIFGARIYKNLEFDENTPMQSWRMPGWRNIRHNDIVVFNYVRGEKTHRIEFNFSTVYVKRCVGLPGDSVSIRNGYLYNSSASMPLGYVESQKFLSEADPESYRKIQAVRHARPHEWTIRQMGPLFIPRKGSTIPLDEWNFRLYRNVIEFETQAEVLFEEQTPYINGKPVGEYTFDRNYYFMCGDNLTGSVDSRSWGFVPEDFIIGVAPRTWISRQPENHKIRWNRVLKRFNT